VGGGEGEGKRLGRRNGDGEDRGKGGEGEGGGWWRQISLSGFEGESAGKQPGTPRARRLKTWKWGGSFNADPKLEKASQS